MSSHWLNVKIQAKNTKPITKPFMRVMANSSGVCARSSDEILYTLYMLKKVVLSYFMVLLRIAVESNRGKKLLSSLVGRQQMLLYLLTTAGWGITFSFLRPLCSHITSLMVPLTFWMVLITCCRDFLSWAVHETCQFVMFPLKFSEKVDFCDSLKTWVAMCDFYDRFSKAV